MDMGVPMNAISGIAESSLQPIAFGERCAAFINTDLRNALQQEVPRQDVIAGLVYSICMNYNNRVRGARKVGKKIFMQGGVCYNRAVPLAMAAPIDRADPRTGGERKRPATTRLQGASRRWMAGPTRLELATSGVTGRRSDQLNYDPASSRRGRTSSK